MKRLFTTDQLAEYLSVPKKTVYAWKASQKIPPQCVVMVGRLVRFDQKEVDVWLESQRAG